MAMALAVTPTTPKRDVVEADPGLRDAGARAVPDCAPRAGTTSRWLGPRSCLPSAPGRLARFHHTPSTSGTNRPDIAKQKAHATAPRMPVSFRLATAAPPAPITSSRMREVIRRRLHLRLRVDDLVVEVVRQRIGHRQQQSVGSGHRSGHAAGGDQTRNHVRQAGHLRRREHDDVRVQEELVDLENPVGVAVADRRAGRSRTTSGSTPATSHGRSTSR